MDVIKETLTEQGIDLKFEAEPTNVSVQEGKTEITMNKDGETYSKEADAILVATSRKPNTKGFDLEKAGVKLSDDGSIKVNEYLQTNQGNIFALGDVKGGAQFTYISLDDYRIIRDYLSEKDGHTTEKRKNKYPLAIFTTPPIAHVGMSETKAKEAGYSVKIAKKKVATIPNAKIVNNETGLFKAIIDEETEEIVGATLFGVESHEAINLFTMGIQSKIPYKTLRDQIYTHPSISEALNELLDV